MACWWWLVAAAFFILHGQAAILNIDTRIVSKNVSSTLDALLDKRRYDKRIRPNYGGHPVTITVNLLVKSMGSVTETDESYTMDIYFRQVWYDSRLQFSPLPGRGQLSLPWLFMGLVWKPDTFFMNGKRSHLHRITVPNTFLRLRHDGYITYSMRLTVTARCPMHLRKFPLDSQKCPLLISSYGYGIEDVLYRWDSSDNVKIEPYLEIAQFDLVSVATEDHRAVRRGSPHGDEYSMIKAEFHLKRHTGFFMLQMYVPCVLIVCCSWVSFWIDPQDAPGRVMLGVMNALSLTTLGMGGKAQMPKVSYPTAIDWFVILCNCFVFAVMVEYAAVNLVDKITKDLKKLIQDRLRNKDSPPEEGAAEKQRAVSMVNLPVSSGLAPDPIPLSASAEQLPGDKPASHYGKLRLHTELQVPSITVTTGDDDPDKDEGVSLDPDRDEGVSLEEEDTTELPQGAPRTLSRTTRRSMRRSLMRPVRAWRSYRFLPREEDISRQMESHEEPPKFTDVDINARKVFPLAFLFFQATYWGAYLYYITDEAPST